MEMEIQEAEIRKDALFPRYIVLCKGKRAYVRRLQTSVTGVLQRNAQYSSLYSEHNEH